MIEQYRKAICKSCLQLKIITNWLFGNEVCDDCRLRTQYRSVGIQ